MSELAVMPLIDYKTACDKIREKVVLTTVAFEDTDFGYFKSAPFNFEEGKTYTINISVTDNYVDFVVGSDVWNNTSPPWVYTFENNSFTAPDDYEAHIYLNKENGITIDDILSATIECNDKIVANFVEPQKIKSGELADKVDEVYMAGASDFGLKGKGQGEFVHFENVHPIEHEVKVSVSDPTAKVKVNGKNLLNINRERGKPLTVDSWNITNGLEFEFDKYYLAYLRTNKYYHNYGTATIDNNTISLSVSNAWFGIGFPIKTLPNTTYTISAELDTDKTFPAVTYYDNSGNFITEINANLIKSLTFTTPSNCDFVVISFVNKIANEATTISNVQLEVGSATEYEPYTETEYTAAADGTVEGVKSISPVMNLSTDKAGAVINAECFLDPQAVITDLTNTVITLGGEI